MVLVLFWVMAGSWLGHTSTLVDFGIIPRLVDDYRSRHILYRLNIVSSNAQTCQYKLI